MIKATKDKTSTIVPKICYGQIIKGLDRLKGDNKRDIQEHPKATRVDYQPSVVRLIEKVMRANHQRCSQDLCDRVIAYLKEKGILIDYLGGCQFPETILPTEQEIVEKTEKEIKKIFG